jgi:hypothetical protein
MLRSLRGREERGEKPANLQLPTYFWDDSGTVDERRRAYRDWLDRHSELPPLVE